MDSFEATYRAASSGDPRLDGRLFIAVTSTGIYCRPICPVPMPSREVVRFFRAAAAAEEQGFRACRRCRPEASPDSPDWDTRADVVGRGLQLIAEGVVDADGVDGLARRLSVGRRQLQRMFVAELGSGPLAVARSRRAGLAKQLLEQTDAPSTQVAFAAGFGSVRAYHDTLRRLYGQSPREIRARRPEATDGGLSLRLAHRPPLAWKALLDFLRLRAIPGVEQVDGDGFVRAVRTEDGTGVVVRLEPSPAGPSVALRLEAIEDVPLLAGIVQGARRLLDLDADPAAIDDALRTDPALEPLVSGAPGLRLPGCFDGFELAVRAIVGQQVSVAGARTTLGTLARRLGTPLARPVGSVTHLFPTPEAFAAAPDLGMPSTRAAAIRRLADLVFEGELELSGGADPEASLRTLTSIPGVGPWTAAYVAMRALRDPDAFPAGDLGLQRAASRLGLGDVAERAERWRPWRGYAAMHLWHAPA
jgi:AraC family transcriptional regulator, regulatory protein of adaptative response / DNA-3-methyladenine glycosylase II